MSCFVSSMEEQYIPKLFFIVFILLPSTFTALDTIYANQEIKDGETLVSEGEMFELGFFSPGKSKNRYLGIWYNKISYCTVVWVANRETPITDRSGKLKLSRNGNLVILSGGNTTIWPSNSTVSMGSDNPLMVVVMQLLDTGNLVVWKKNKMIWQSFDYPGDTMLPGQKIGKDLVTGLQRSMTSWKSPDDPSIGAYHSVHDTNGFPQTLRWRGDVLIGRFGPWNGLGFSGFPSEIENKIYSSKYVMNEKEIYHTFELKSSVVQRIVLTSDGRALFLQWIERIKEWFVYTESHVDNCDRFSLCGPYGICSINKHPPCTCMQGFEPRNPDEWEESDWINGCVRKKPLNCGNNNGDKDGFLKIARVKIPDTRRSWYNVSMTLGECQMACKSNCSCTGYTSLDIRNGGSGCLMWLDELLDTREYDVNQDIYIRVAASELEGLVNYQFDLNKKNIKVIVVIITSFVASLLFIMAYASRKIKRSPDHMIRQGKWNVHDEKNTRLLTEHLDELQFFRLYEVAKATSSFSVSNKIGEGGFGPVYKGVLEDGREIAVKRLSETSQQGLDEFKNEVICIAKLQHRNLVKLLGYCIHKKELILIYEYMANKSLDCGYISPEYAVHGRFSIKSDVFSFGVLVLEIISGMKNKEFSHGDHCDNLLGYAWRLYKEGRSIELMSASLQASYVTSDVLRSIHVALLCVQHHAADRPTMLSVVLMLVSEGALPEPKHPAFFNEESCRELESLPSVDESMITLVYAR
ncbi:hypothetical protein QVD17_28806 [Tagetes erecta]|uniref:Receptor-like serine/threonine-protein kinase n=1 Tax=Tagetes erecta TaxID=13708 RepID=A0AAD8KE06_TARER|nr:hypothetical protein QVD17_28806 [Tagetes erecta]